jgi:hypothetical protein
VFVVNFHKRDGFKNCGELVKKEASLIIGNNNLIAPLLNQK